MVYRQEGVNFGICGEEAMILVYKFDIFEIFSNFENENQILVYKENPCKIWYIIRKKNFGIRRKTINFDIYQDTRIRMYFGMQLINACILVCTDTTWYL